MFAQTVWKDEWLGYFLSCVIVGIVLTLLYAY